MRESLNMLLAAISLSVACTYNAERTTESSNVEEPAWLGNLEATLLDLEYPFIGEHGEFVCALYEIEAGDEVYTEKEFYHLDRIERRLSNDTTLREFMRDRGLHRVKTCDEAREFMSLKLEFEGLAGPVDNSRLPPAPVEEGEQIRDSDSIDKIIDAVARSSVHGKF